MATPDADYADQMASTIPGSFGQAQSQANKKDWGTVALIVLIVSFLFVLVAVAIYYGTKTSSTTTSTPASTSSGSPTYSGSSGAAASTSSPAPAPAVPKTYTQTYTLGSTITNSSSPVGTFTVPTDLTSATSLVANWTATTNNQCCVSGNVSLYQSGNSTGFVIVDGANKQGSFTNSVTTAGSALPSWFTAGAPLSVVMGVAYSGWYISSGATVTITLTYV
jgi:hypothetical protein